LHAFVFLLLTLGIKSRVSTRVKGVKRNVDTFVITSIWIQWTGKLVGAQILSTFIQQPCWKHFFFGQFALTRWSNVRSSNPLLSLPSSWPYYSFTNKGVMLRLYDQVTCYDAIKIVSTYCVLSP